jgi:short subunit fatty acids transporter
MAGMSWLAVPLGVFGCLAITFASQGYGGAGLNALGFLFLMVGALIFLRGNRLKRVQSEERRHQEMMEAIAKRDRPA